MDYVSIKELALRLGMDRSACRKWVKNLGYAPAKRRMPDSGNQRALAVTADEADEIVKHRSEQGFIASEQKTVPSDWGVFYLIQLVPDLDGKRIKLGFATSINDRLSSHRTAAPTAKIVKTWPCKRTWEQAAIDCLAVNLTSVGGEVFDCNDLDALERRGEDLFAMLQGRAPGKAPEG